jgi:hypothetical protein
VLNFWRQLAQLRQAGLIGRAAPLERVLLDDQVWAFRVGAVTTIANLSPGEVRRRFEPGEAGTALASTNPSRTGMQIAGEITLEPWEALVAGPKAVSQV